MKTGSPTGFAVKVNETFWQTVNDGFAPIANAGASAVMPVKSPSTVTPLAVSVFNPRVEYLTQGSEPTYFPVFCRVSLPAISAAT